jgi:hypothetical protein
MGVALGTGEAEGAAVSVAAAGASVLVACGDDTLAGDAVPAFAVAHPASTSTIAKITIWNFKRFVIN